LAESPRLARAAPFVAVACALVAALAGWLLTGWALVAGGGMFEPGAPEGVPEAALGLAELTSARVLRAATPFFVVAGAHALAGVATRWLPAGSMVAPLRDGTPPPSGATRLRAVGMPSLRFAPKWGAARVTWLVTLIAFLLAALLAAPVAAGGLVVFAAIALGPPAIGWGLAGLIAR